MTYKAIFFDLDGTLIDTLVDLAGAMNYALGQLDQPTHPIERCRMMIGNGVATFAKRALADDKLHLRPKILEIMKARYAATCFDNSAAYPGIDELIADLQKRSIALAVVTNKDHDHAEDVCGHYFAKGTFGHIIGVSPETPVKPDPKGTLAALEEMGLSADEVLFVGDSEVDIHTAIAANITAVGVTWGFRDKQTLLDAGAQIIVDTPGQIMDLL